MIRGAGAAAPRGGRCKLPPAGPFVGRRRGAVVSRVLLLLAGLLSAGRAVAGDEPMRAKEHAYDEAIEQVPRAVARPPTADDPVFAELRAVTSGSARLVVTDSRRAEAAVRHDTIEVSRGWLERFTDDDTRAAGYALLLAATDGGPAAHDDGQAAFALARAGRDPAALLTWLELAGRHAPALAPDADTRAARLRELLAELPALEARFGEARLAMAFGRFDVARALLEPVAARLPWSAEVHTNLGLAWMGLYYERHGLQAATWTRLQGFVLDPGAAPPALRRDEIAAALARGFALPAELPTSAVRGGDGEVPEPLARARAALAEAHRLAPEAPDVLLNRFVIEAEAATWGDTAARDRLRAGVLAAIDGWGAELASLGWLGLGVAAWLDPAGEPAANAAAAVRAFEKADAIGHPLARYNLGLVLTFDPAFASRRAEGIAALRGFVAAPEARRAAMAARGGLLPTSAWPLGAGRVALTSTSPALRTLAAAIRGEAIDGVEPTVVGDYVSLTLPDGSAALIEPGKAAWVVLADAAPSATPAPSASLPRPRPATAPVLARGDAVRVSVRSDRACPDGRAWSPRSAGEACPTLLEVRLLE